MSNTPSSLKRLVPRFLKQWLAGWLFTFEKYVLGFAAPTTPRLDPPGLLYLQDVLSRTSCYLEYGTGGSTLLAWKSADVVVAVDSDARILAAVDKALAAARRRPTLSALIHVDIGVTRGWGKPLFTRLTPARVARWERYATAPWDFLRRHAIEPDTILIDGRFRVACALLCLLNLKERSPCLVLIDDYRDRSYYGAVAEFADLVSTHGALAVFRRKEPLDRERCRQVLKTYYCDWR